MLISLATLLIMFAGLLLCIAAPLSGHFGEVLREYSAKAFAAAILLTVASSLIAQNSWFISAIGFIAASLIAFAIVELRSRLHPGSSRLPTFTNFRRIGKVRLSQDQPQEEQSSILEHDEAEPWR